PPAPSAPPRPLAPRPALRLPDESSSWSLSAGAFAVESFGFLPAPATGAGLTMEATPPGWVPALSLSATIFAPRSTEAGVFGMTMQAWSASGGVCPLRRVAGRIAWNACAELALAGMTATGLGTQTIDTTHPLLVGAQVRTSLRFRIAGPFSA